MRSFLLFVIAVSLAGCASGGADQPAPRDEPRPVAAAPASSPRRNSVTVTAGALNVRRAPSGEAQIVGKVSRGDELIVLGMQDGWTNVRLADGTAGWVASQYVSPDGLPREAPRRTAAAKPKRPSRDGCPADADFSFIKVPVPSFEEVRRPGLVVVDATVDAKGNVTATRIVSNSTGDASLGKLAEREIKGAKFSPPIRNCVPKAFIFSYKRSF